MEPGKEKNKCIHSVEVLAKTLLEKTTQHILNKITFQKMASEL